MKRTIATLYTALLCIAAQAQDISFLQSVKQDSAVDLTLILDWKYIVKKKKDKTYQPAHISLKSSSFDSISLPVRVKTRGNRRLEICSYPPLKLKFDKSELTRRDLSSHNEMDIVHHCHEGDQYDQYLLREYLAYKLWEIISPYHFKVQLVRLHYLNSDGTQAYAYSYAFLLENGEELVSRLGGRRNKTPVISSNAIDKKALLQVALFEFMIGNTDWFVTNRHNLDFVAIPEHQFLVTIPYDFDYSGLVSATYAAHHESLDLSAIAIRYYQGWCMSADDVHDALQSFRLQKDNILAIPSRIQGLNERSIKHTTEYLQDFFDIIENPKKLENQIIRHCDMWPVKGKG